MNYCKHCRKPISNPKFCSRSCSASYNNIRMPKRERNKICKECDTRILSNYTYCSQCWKKKQAHFWYSKTSKLTYKDVAGKRSYQKHSRIREWARKTYVKFNLPLYCANCKYDKHHHVCHIRAIRDFPETATISEINAISNLIALCPNCHWEMDNGFLDIHNVKSAIP